MYLLGIDTSSSWLNIAISEDENVLNTYSEFIPQKHIEVLHPAILNLLNETQLTINDIDLFIAVIGPGSFTGIRIAVTCVKGLVYALNKKCVSVISLDLLAYNAVNKDFRFIRPVIDARRNCVYTALYEKQKDKILRRSEYQILRIDDIIKELNPDTVLIGDGIGVYREIIDNYRREKEIHWVEEESQWKIQPENIIKLGYEKFKTQGEENIFDLKPFYIYPKECTIKRNSKSRN